jgi:hypothetical protein
MLSTFQNFFWGNSENKTTSNISVDAEIIMDIGKREELVQWFKTIDWRNPITKDIINRIKQNAKTLMIIDKKLIFLPLATGHIDIFEILYDEIKDDSNIMELKDDTNKDGYTLLLYMIKNARNGLDKNKILIEYLEKYHMMQKLGRELLLCVDDSVSPNFELLNTIINIYIKDKDIIPKLVLDTKYVNPMTNNSLIKYLLDNQSSWQTKYPNLLYNIININTDILLIDDENINPFLYAIQKNNDAVFEGILKKYPEQTNELINKPNFLWDIIYIYRQKEIYQNNKILKKCFDKILSKPIFNRELLACIDGYIKIKGQYLHPNIALLKDIIILYEESNNVLVYDSILDSEILYDTKYNYSDQQDISLIFEKISKKDEAFKNTNIMINALTFNNERILDIIINNPKITKLSIEEISNTIIGEIFLLFQSNKYVQKLISQSGISQSDIDNIYNKIITESSPKNLGIIHLNYEFKTYRLINLLWGNSDRKPEKFEYVNSRTKKKYITEFGCLLNIIGKPSEIITKFFKPEMCKTRDVIYDDKGNEERTNWIDKHIANPSNIPAKTAISTDYLEHSIETCNYIFYCYDYTTHNIISIGTVTYSKYYQEKTIYELNGLCVDSKYPGLGLSFINYIKKITKQLTEGKPTRLKLSAIPRYETVKFYKDRASFDFAYKYDNGKAIADSSGLYEMDVNYKKYLKYKAKYMNLHKKLST